MTCLQCTIWENEKICYKVRKKDFPRNFSIAKRLK